MAGRVSRRRFLSGAGRIVPAATLGTAFPARGALGANDRLGIGIVGCGGQGRYDANSMCWVRAGRTAILAVCDIDQQRMDDTAGETKRYFGNTPDQYKDFRALLDRKDIDIVVVATPDHWHAAVTILACQAGKDVYVEKPCSHTIEEGRRMVRAARKYSRMVMVGQQQRSAPHFREAIAYLHAHRPLGRISRTFTLNQENDTPRGMPPDNDQRPSHITEADYDRWLGPAPKRPFHSNRWHYNWRWFLDYGGGMICDWNVHLQDIVHWAMRVDAPKSVAATGGKRALPDERDSPDIMDVLYEYAGPEGDFTQVYTMTKIGPRGRYAEPYGTEFLGTEGSLFINRGFWEVTPETRYTQVDDPEKPGQKKTAAVPRTAPIRKDGGDSVNPHAQSFLKAVDSRRIEDLNCDIEVGHRTATACHLGNIALRLGRKIWWDRDREIIVHQDGSPDAAANRYLTKEYRKGYELPDV